LGAIAGEVVTFSVFFFVGCKTGLDTVAGIGTVAGTGFAVGFLTGAGLLVGAVGLDVCSAWPLSATFGVAALGAAAFGGVALMVWVTAWIGKASCTAFLPGATVLPAFAVKGTTATSFWVDFGLTACAFTGDLLAGLACVFFAGAIAPTILTELAWVATGAMWDKGFSSARECTGLGCENPISCKSETNIKPLLFG
jgi:hypothetical protein